MSVKVRFEFLRYTVNESCTLLPVTLVVKGEVLRPFAVIVKPMAFNTPSAEGMQQKLYAHDISLLQWSYTCITVMEWPMYCD